MFLHISNVISEERGLPQHWESRGGGGHKIVTLIKKNICESNGLHITCLADILDAYICQGLDPQRVNPFKSSRCIKACFYTTVNILNFPTTKGFIMKIFLKLIYQYMAIFFNFSPTSSHFHPLQVENFDSNSRLVVDEMTMINSGLKELNI